MSGNPLCCLERSPQGLAPPGCNKPYLECRATPGGPLLPCTALRPWTPSMNDLNPHTIRIGLTPDYQGPRRPAGNQAGGEKSVPGTPLSTPPMCAIRSYSPLTEQPGRNRGEEPVNMTVPSTTTGYKWVYNRAHDDNNTGRMATSSTSGEMSTWRSVDMRIAFPEARTRTTCGSNKTLPNQIRPPQVGLRPCGAVRPPQRGSTFLVSGDQQSDPRVFPQSVKEATLPLGDIRPFDRLTLIIAGDIEENPGPTTPASLTSVCSTCGKVIEADTDRASCSTPGCSAACHNSEECCGTVTREWKCPTHTPKQRGKCHMCSKTIGKGVTRFACKQPGCSSLCHIGMKFSNIRSTETWRCPNHIATSPLTRVVGCDNSAKQISQPKDGKPRGLICVEPLCTAQCHKIMKCSGLSRCRIDTDWRCISHRPHNSANPPRDHPTTSKSPLPTSTCVTCKKTIRTGVERIRCSTLECDSQCHKGKKCSGLTRVSQEKSLWGWSCGVHTPTNPSPQTQLTSNVLSQHRTYKVPFPRPEKAKCKGCHRTIPKTFLPVACDECGDYYHKGCTGLHRSEADEVALKNLHWSCVPCSTEHKDYTRVMGGTTTETSAQDAKQHQLGSLKIMQWNADGLMSKAHELELNLIKSQHDIVLK